MRHENSQRYAGSKDDNTSRAARLLATRLNPCSIELYQVSKIVSTHVRKQVSRKYN